MRTIKLAFLMVLLTFTVISCKKDTELSKPTFWPILTMNGDKLVIITAGDTYTDAGATATANGEPIEVVVSNRVDNTTPGVYPVSYSAYNADGIPAVATRTVIVKPDEQLIDADHILGNYTLAVPARPNPIPAMSVTRLDVGLYYTNNMYGSNGNNAVINVPAYFYTTDGIVFNIIDASLVGSDFGNNIAYRGTATWNPNTNRLACLFNIFSVGPGSVFSRTWQHN